MNIKKYLGMGIIYGSVGVIIGWGWQSGKMSSWYGWGQLLGLIGLILMSAVLVLEARVGWLEDYFYSQNKAYVNHHLIGGISFILLLFHPILLGVKLLPTTNQAQNWGILALWLMIGLLFITFFTKIDYRKWHLTHKFMAVVFVFAGIHWLTISSDVSTNLILRTYVMIIYTLGIAAIVYRTLLPKLMVKKYNYKVINKKLINNILFLQLEATGEKLIYRTGQFIFLERGGESHPLSLASNGERLEVVVKTNGDWTKKLTELKINETVKIEGPYGKFGQNVTGDEEVWVAGGVGIVPFIGLAKNLGHKKITLYYSVKNKSEIINEKEFKTKISANFKFVLIESEKQGRLVARQVVSQNKNTDYLLCGPPAMVVQIKNDLQQLKVKPEKIISEEFFLR